MSLRDSNPSNRARPRRVAIVLSNPAQSPTTGWPVGFWWSELSHPYFALSEKGYQVEVFSYAGGKVLADALSDPRDPSGYSASDLISLGFIHTPALMKLLEDTPPVSAIDAATAGWFAKTRTVPACWVPSFPVSVPPSCRSSVDTS